MVDRRPMLARRLASAAMRIVYTDTSHTLSHLATSNVPELINVTLVRTVGPHRWPDTGPFCEPNTNARACLVVVP
jgi:hypothetical protein